MSRMRQTSDTTTKKARKMPMSKYSVGCCGREAHQVVKGAQLSRDVQLGSDEKVIPRRNHLLLGTGEQMKSLPGCDCCIVSVW